MTNTLDKAANVILILTCLVVLGFTAYRWGPSQKVPTYAVGEVFDPPIVALLPQPRGPVVLLALSSRCQVCSLSMPSFRQLELTRRTNGLSLPLVVLAREDPQTVRSFLLANNLNTDAIVDVRAVKSKLEQCPVPHTLVPNAGGVVVGSWVGLLTDNRLEEVIRALSGALKRPGG